MAIVNCGHHLGIMGIIEELERLSKLHDSGTLSDDEFAKAKARLLTQQEQRSTARASAAAPMAAAPRKSGTARIIRGIISLVVGLGIFLWAREHSPYMGLGAMLARMDSFVLQPKVYNGALIISALLGLNGLVLLVLGFQADQRKD